MVSTEDVQQIIEALMATEPMQYLISMMEKEAPQHVAGEEPLPAAEPAAPAAPAEPAVPAAPVAEKPAVEAEPKKPAVDPAAKRYECDDEDKEMMHKYMSDECTEEDYMSHMSDKRHKYMSHDDPEDQLTNVDPYKKEPNREEQRQMKSDYSKLHTDLVDTQKRLATIETERATTDRYSKLERKRLEFVFEMDKEVARCSPEKMTDPQFEDHLDLMVENYQRIPVSGSMPMIYAPDDALQTSKPGDAERYAKEAVKYCTSERARGNNISFEEAFEHVQKETA